MEALATLAGNSLEACVAPEEAKAALRAELERWQADYAARLV